MATEKMEAGGNGKEETDQQHQLPKRVQQHLDIERAGVKPGPTRVEVMGLNTRAYLDQTVVPILIEGMAVLAKERPPDPIEYLAAYLLKYKERYQTDYYPKEKSS
ncbi:PREDICTED: protein dpy-30 homolog [Amphimedon queenslandica]|uniref:Protein dpy-30 homolog n=1 Tax=Amphimedon queenslandica TaxID=400682 RepID=A0A1X7TM36_AMPQE|nr:PREDICTED: protein dpy-30 homolog [Amphimedon queenslandica]|eukprot:XP_003390243.1 PREDICTED: protein dpy-30 homolog [Amphimedon queenslandica]